MKQIVVISGKGGTGKTVMTSAFTALASNRVTADCDVDAADLHLLLQPQIKERCDFKSGLSAVFDRKKCIECGKCLEVCRFEAIDVDFSIDHIACEGCGFCANICPAGAITMRENSAGEWFISQTRFGLMVHAKLGAAQENSGKLVSLVRKKTQELAEREKCDYVIVDGAPGIGCPVIASLSGIDLAVVVTEPTMSGLHDAARVIKVARHFGVPVKMIINKFDLNLAMTKDIEAYCLKQDVPLVGKVPFDKAVVEAMVQGKTIMEYKDTPAKKEIERIWRRINEYF